MKEVNIEICTRPIVQESPGAAWAEAKKPAKYRTKKNMTAEHSFRAVQAAHRSR